MSDPAVVCTLSLEIERKGDVALVRLVVSAKSNGCSLELVNLGKRVRQLLGITNLLGIFTIIGESGITLGF
jgi:anti-sigma B factor antagonist